MKTFSISKSEFDALPEEIKWLMLGILQKLLDGEVKYIISIDGFRIANQDQFQDWRMKNGYMKTYDLLF